MPSIKQILMNRDGMTEQAAQDLIEEAQEAFTEYLEAGDQEAAYNICQEYFGLEPDYLDEIM
jgi:uncharacterized tellurite resistance protein B-like protein